MTRPVTAVDVLETEYPVDAQVLEVNGAPAHGQIERLRRLIASRLDADCADLLAVPEGATAAGGLAWRAPGGGALRRPRDAARQSELQADVDVRLARLRALAEALAAQGAAGEVAATAIRTALTFPPGVDPLYEADGAPTLVLWGIGTADQAAALLGERPVRAVASAAAVVDPAQAGHAPSSLRFAALWAAPLVLCAAALWLGWMLLQPPPMLEVEIARAPAPAPDPTIGLPARLAALDEALTGAGAASARFMTACFDPASQSDGSAGPQCAAGMMPAQPREVMLVLDATGSMNYPIDTPDRLERARMAANRVNNPAARSAADAAIMARGGESRIEVARRTIFDVVAAAPDDVDFGLLTFHDCKTTMFRGRYKRRDVNRLDGELGRVEPSSGTALALAIQRAVGLMSGGESADDPVNMVLISDGYDACGGDPCAAAVAAKRARPGLVINVIDLAQAENLACIADATGGAYAGLGASLALDDLSHATGVAAGAGSGRRCVPIR